MAETNRPQPLHVPYTNVASLTYAIPTYLGALIGVPGADAFWTLPALNDVEHILSGSILYVVNNGVGTITLAAAAGNTIGGGITIDVAPGNTAQLVAGDAAAWQVLATASGVVPPPTPQIGVQPVRCTTTVDLAAQPWATSAVYLVDTITVTYASAPTFDDVVLTVGNRVLLWKQVVPLENGTYVVDTVAPNLVLVRADTSLVSGYTVVSAEGTLFSSAMFVLTSPAPVIVGVDPLVFQRTTGVAGDATTFGYEAVADADAVAVGSGASALMGGVALGKDASATDLGTALGPSSVAGEDGVAIGILATASTASVANGAGAAADNNGVAVGAGASAGDTAVAVGQGAAATAFSAVLGASAGAGSVGSGNTLTGPGAGANLNGNANVFGGSNAGAGATTENSVAFGADAAAGLTANFGSYLGTQAGQNVSGERGVGVGYGAGVGTTGPRNIALGFGAGAGTTGSDNLHAGTITGATSGSFQVLLGAGAVTTVATMRDYVIAIGNGNVATYTGSSGQIGRGNSAVGTVGNNLQSNYQFGNSNTATVNSDFSMQLGYSNSTGGSRVFMFGENNSTGTAAANHIAVGRTNSAPNNCQSSQQFGQSNSLTGACANVTQLGRNTIASGTQSVQAGDGNTGSGGYIAQFGIENICGSNTSTCSQFGSSNVMTTANTNTLQAGSANSVTSANFNVVLTGFSNVMESGHYNHGIFGSLNTCASSNVDVHWIGSGSTLNGNHTNMLGGGTNMLVGNATNNSFVFGHQSVVITDPGWTGRTLSMTVDSTIEANDNLSLGYSIVQSNCTNTINIGRAHDFYDCNGVIAIGSGLYAGVPGGQSFNTVLIGTNISAIGGQGNITNCVTVGTGFTGDNTVMVGNSQARANCTLVGMSSTAFGARIVLVGNNSVATIGCNNTILLGYGILCGAGEGTILLGNDIVTGSEQDDSIYIGRGITTALTCRRNIAIGTAINIPTLISDAMIMGTSATALTSATMAYGFGARANGAQTTVFGYESGRTSSGASLNNTAFGYQTLYNLTTGARNCAMGNTAIYYNTTGINNTAFGSAALGTNALSTQTPAAYSNCAAFGQNAMVFHSTGDFCVAVGTAAMRGSLPATIAPAQNINASDTAVGNEVMNFCHNSSFNSAVGRDALKHGGSPVNNCAYGFQSIFCPLATVTTNAPTNNCAYGFSSMMPNAGATTLANNCAFGNFAMGAIAPAVANSCAYGYEALSVVLVSGGCAFGYQALRLNTSGTGNSAFGTGAGAAITTGSNNTVSGSGAAASLTVGSGCTVLGAGADVVTNATDRIAIGRAVVNTVNSSAAIGAGAAQWIVAQAGGIAAAGSAQSGFYSICPANTKAVAGNLNLAITDVGPQVLIVATVTGATDTWTLPTGAALAAKFPANPIDGSYQITIRNETANAITIAPNTGITLGTGATTVAATSTVIWKMTYTAANTFVFQRVGTMTL